MTINAQLIAQAGSFFSNISSGRSGRSAFPTERYRPRNARPRTRPTP